MAWLTVPNDKRAASADLLLRLDERADFFDNVRSKLRPGGAWAIGICAPTAVEDWIRVEAYMGFFERIDAMLDDDLLDISYVDDSQGYRYKNIIANATIRTEKHSGAQRDEWKWFIALATKLKVQIPE